MKRGRRSGLKGSFITLEGPEGSGKTTQAQMLTEFLTAKGIDVVRTREPGGVSIAEKLREMLLDPDNIIFPKTELLLYASGRAQHTQELIMPALKEGKYVICERYVHASLAYQGYGRGLDMKLIKQLNRISTSGIKPNITFILDIDVEDGLKRVQEANGKFDRLESENIGFHKKVRTGYIELSREDPNIVVLDGGNYQDKICHKMIQILKARRII
ncbi:dTMP kinase [Elusimicrobiota bacterium]